MTLKDLSIIVTGSIQECIERKVSIESVDIYMLNDDFALPVNYAQLRFSDVVDSHGILILDNQE